MTRWSSRTVAPVEIRETPVVRPNHSTRASSPIRAGTTVDTVKPTVMASSVRLKVAVVDEGTDERSPARRVKHENDQVHAGRQREPSGLGVGHRPTQELPVHVVEGPGHGGAERGQPRDPQGPPASRARGTGPVRTGQGRPAPTPTASSGAGDGAGNGARGSSPLAPRLPTRSGRKSRDAVGSSRSSGAGDPSALLVRGPASQSESDRPCSADS